MGCLKVIWSAAAEKQREFTNSAYFPILIVCEQAVGCIEGGDQGSLILKSFGSLNSTVCPAYKSCEGHESSGYAGIVSRDLSPFAWCIIGQVEQGIAARTANEE
jgi:hypothetical protein